MENSNRDHWMRQAKHVARRVNAGWWLDALSAPLLILGIISALAFLLLRREIPDLEKWQMLAASVGAMVILALGCWAWVAHKFEKPEQALVRIEASMEMRNSLSAAQAGVAPWPPPSGVVKAGLAWQWQRICVPPAGVVALLATGLLIPITARDQNESNGPEEPQTWKQLGAELDKLTKEEVVDESYLEETRKRLDELKAQEEEQWFSHSSLEATDSLKKSHRAETERIARELGRTEKALGNLEKNTGAASATDKNRMLEDFEQALQGLQNGAMKPNPKLLDQLKRLDPKDMAKLTPEQMQQLRENLKKHQEAMKNGQGQGEGDDWSDELLAGDGDSPGEGDCEGDGPGQGRVNRGPGHAPGVLGAEKDLLETGQLTGLEAKDLSRSTPGDLLELQDGEHDVNLSSSAISAGGNTDATGKGGDRVWRDSLDPAEQKTLKRFFE